MAAGVSTLVSVLLLATTATAAAAAIVPVPGPATLVATDPVDQTPNARNGETRAFAEIGDVIYVGGTFTQARSVGAVIWQSHPYLFAYHRASGAIVAGFAPVLDGAVNALAVSPNGHLIVGGVFRNVNGQPRRNLVALDPVFGGTVASWEGRSDGGTVRDLDVSAGKLYVGGAFNWLNGTAHAGLARLDAATGEIDPTFAVDIAVGRHDVAPYVWTLDVSPDGDTLVFGGNFREVEGLPREQIAMVDLTGTPTVVDWNSNQRFQPNCSWQTFTHYVQDLNFGEDSSYFVVGTNGGAGWPAAYCDALLRFETATRGSNIDATWVNFTGNDTITAVAVRNGIAYLGGHFRWLNNPNRSDAAGNGAIDRLGVGAVTVATGMPVNWNPRRSGGSALPPGAVSWGPDVPVLWFGSDGLYFGHDSDGMGNEYHGRLGMFPTAGGRGITPRNPPTGATGHLYLASPTGDLTKVPFDGTTLGAATVSNQPNLVGAGAIWRVHDRVYWARSVAGTPTGARLDISTFNGNTVGGSWEASGYNDWFNALAMNAAFYLDGRLYYTRTGSGNNQLFYRYFELDGNYLGGTEFVVPTSGMTWTTVRGMAWVDGNVVFGSTDGRLRSVPFDPTAGVAVDAAAGTVLAEPDPALDWSNRSMFFAVE
ncbi:delta-60 repeat domain-containing protein [Solwaraspora sp. WMMB335]|uniref:delta-60 repeat domain-containing protein n=1 Tax=Solwaraspora sp. WMMB335 TaxID=3404118 RepID=UPI003B923764